MADYGSTQTSTSTLGGTPTDIPVSATVPPGETAPVTLMGGPKAIDGNSKYQAPIANYVYDGYDKTQGLKADTAATDSTSSWTVIAMLKGLYAKLAGTLTVSGAVTEANSAAIKANLDNLVTNTADLLGDGDNLATIVTNTANIPAKGTAIMAGSTPVTIATNDTVFSELLLDTDNLATIVTNTNKIPASPAQESGNLATLAGIVSSNKAAVKAASGDFADGSQVAIGTTTQTKATDGSATSWSVIQLLKGIFDKFLNGTIAVTGTFWQATQPVSVASLPALPANQSVNAAQIGGQMPTLDNTTILAVSMRGKSTVAGDTSALMDSIGRQLIGRSTVAAYTLASTTTSGSTQNSGDIAVGSYTEISIDINTTAQAGTSPTIQYFYERKGADGIYYILWQSAVLTTALNTLSTSIGAGMAYNQSLGVTGRLRWVIGGSATPTFTHTANIQGK